MLKSLTLIYTLQSERIRMLFKKGNSEKRGSLINIYQDGLVLYKVSYCENVTKYSLVYEVYLKKHETERVA